MKIKHTLLECRIWAAKKGGCCLSSEYKNYDSLLEWQCGNKHKWFASLATIKKSWCKQCFFDNRKLTLQDCQTHAFHKGGLCLSDHYKNIDSNLKWRCDQGHTWLASFYNVKNNSSWCPYCAGQIITLKDCQNFAFGNNGKCLSNKYKNSNTKMKWQCKNEHKWFASFKAAKSWCPICRNIKHITLDDCHKLAKKRDFICLSTQYENAKIKLTWQCSKNHIWQASYDNIKRDRGCPHCSHNISKPQQEIYEYLTNYFPTLKIDLNNTKVISPLHLDIYIPSLKIGIEFDGEYWHYSDWAIKEGALDRMSEKDELCKLKNINLLRIRENDWKEDKTRQLNCIVNAIQYGLGLI